MIGKLPYKNEVACVIDSFTNQCCPCVVRTRSGRNQNHISRSRCQRVSAHIKCDVANARHTDGACGVEFGKLGGEGVILIPAVQVKKEGRGAGCDRIDTHRQEDLCFCIRFQDEQYLETRARREIQRHRRTWFSVRYRLIVGVVKQDRACNSEKIMDIERAVAPAPYT